MPPICKYHPPLPSKERNKGERRNENPQTPNPVPSAKTRGGRTRRVPERMAVQLEEIAAGVARLALTGCWSDRCFRDCCVLVAAVMGCSSTRGRGWGRACTGMGRNGEEKGREEAGKYSLRFMVSFTGKKNVPVKEEEMTKTPGCRQYGLKQKVGRTRSLWGLD